MSSKAKDNAAGRADRQRILRRATYYTLGFMLATLVVASAGSALIAWLLSVTGLPFRETWLVLTLVVLAVPMIGISVGEIRKRVKSSRTEGGD